MAPSKRNKNARSQDAVSESAANTQSQHQQEEEQREQQEEATEELTMSQLIRVLTKFGDTQVELLQAVKELKNPSPAPKPNTEQNEKISQEESAAAKESEQKGPSFVTQEDVVAMLERELHRTNEDWKYIPQPPYPSSLISLPYPKGYETPTFVLFDGRKGSPKEHISRFIDALGPHAGDHNLRLRKFSKTLTDRAYTWYTTLAPGSVRTWEDLASKFCKKYFEHEERVTITQLNYTRQRESENLVDFIRRFRDLALDCYDEKGEKYLVEICISNIMPEYRVYLENAGIDQFSGLMDAAKRTSLSVKAQKAWRSEKKDAHQTLAIEDKSSYKRKRETFPAVPCGNEEFHAILDSLIADGVIKPPRPQKPPTKEEKSDPRYCRYHQFVGHPSPACQVLRRILHEKINDGTLELSTKRQFIDEDPLPKRRGKESCCVITEVGGHMEEDTVHLQNVVCQYQCSETIDKVAWSRYCNSRGYNTPWPGLNQWGGDADLPAPQNQHLGAAVGACSYSRRRAYYITEVDDEMEQCADRNYRPAATRVLQQNPKFKSLFNQLEYGPHARQAAAEALMCVSEEYGPQCFAAEAMRTMSILENDNAIVFRDSDMEVPFPDHRKPLFLEAQVNDVFVMRALVDTGSSLNIIPLYVLKAAGIPMSRIVKSEIKISGFAADWVRKQVSGPSKFAPQWEGPFVIKESYTSGYYVLASITDEVITSLINGK